MKTDNKSEKKIIKKNKKSPYKKSENLNKPEVQIPRNKIP